MPTNKTFVYVFLFFSCPIIFLSYPGLSGDFWFDDVSNILTNQNFPIKHLSINNLWKASLSGVSSEIGRPLSVFSFALNSYFSQFEAYNYKLSNIIIHALNTTLLFYLSINLLSLPALKIQLNLTLNNILFLSAAISLAWGISPINIANVLYVVQRMNELSTFFILIGILFYLRVRTIKTYSSGKQFFLFTLFILILLLAILSKENGALLAALILIIEIILQSNDNKVEIYNGLFVRLILVFSVIIPGIVASYWLATHYESLIASYQLRNFTLLERVLTEPRVLFYYIQQTLFPEVYKLSLFHDDFAKSTHFTAPISTAVSILSLMLASILAVLKRKKYPFIFFGLFWFLIAHSLESSIIPLELVFEHRNYLPSYGIFFVLIVLFYLACKRYDKTQIFYPCMALYIFTLSINSYIASSVRGNTALLLKTFVEEHPRSARAHYSWAELNEKLFGLDKTNTRYYTQAIKHAAIATELDPDMINALFLSLTVKKENHASIEDEYETLLRRLKTAKPHSSNVRTFNKLLTHSLEKANDFDHKLIDKLSQAYSANPNLKGENKAIFYHIYAQYLFKRDGISMRILELATLSTNALPNNLKLKIFLIQALINLQQFSAAKNLIPLLVKMDTLNLHQAEINMIKKTLNEKLSTTTH